MARYRVLERIVVNGTTMVPYEMHDESVFAPGEIETFLASGSIELVEE